MQIIIQQYQQQQLLMSGHIKNFQLVYQSKPNPFPLRSKKMEGNRSLLRDVNIIKIITRNAKTNHTQKESKQTKESEYKKEEERLFVVSQFKNTAQVVPIQNITKHFKLNRQRIKTFANDCNFNNHISEKIIKCYEGKQVLKTAKSTQKMEKSNLSTNQNDLKSQILMIKKNIMSTYTQKQQRQFIKREGQRRHFTSHSKKQSKTLSTDKIYERKHAILTNNAPELKKIKSESFIIVEYPSERVIITHRATLAGEIASLTKIMTFYTILHIAASKNIDIKTTIIKVSSSVSLITGTIAQLIQGEQYTVEQLLYGLMLPSGNDAANELALWGGSLLADIQKGDKSWQIFVNQMNKQARAIGLKHTQFGNPHGLPNQCAKSTASDLAKLCCKCMKNMLFKRIVSCKSYKIAVQSTKGTRIVQWQNTNKLLRREGFIGLKTGITATAGPCLAAAYTFRGKTYISIVLRAPKISSRFKQTRHLLSWTMGQLYKDLSEEQYIQLRALKRQNYELDSDYSEEQEEFIYGNNSHAEHQRRCNILDYQL